MKLNPFTRSTRKRPRGRLHMYLDTANQFRWTVYASNGNPMAVSSEGYNRADDCHTAAIILFGPERDWELIIDNDNPQLHEVTWYIPLNRE